MPQMSQTFRRFHSASAARTSLAVSRPQLRERVDDDTEDDVQRNDVHEQEEAEVEEELAVEVDLRRLDVGDLEDLGDAASLPEADVERGEVAALERVAHRQALDVVEVEGQRVEAAEEVGEEEDDDADQRDGGHQLVQVLRDGLHHVHRCFVDVDNQYQMKTLVTFRLPGREYYN
jgi:hypothetical protein